MKTFPSDDYGVSKRIEYGYIHVGNGKARRIQHVRSWDNGIEAVCAFTMRSGWNFYLCCEPNDMRTIAKMLLVAADDTERKQTERSQRDK